MSTIQTSSDPRSANIDMGRFPPTLQRALASARLSRQEWSELLKRLQIGCEPIGAEALQRMLMETGHAPNDNEFSRDLIAQREE